MLANQTTGKIVLSLKLLTIHESGNRTVLKFRVQDFSKSVMVSSKESRILSKEGR